jgi:iron(III) transport system permease protein
MVSRAPLAWLAGAVAASVIAPMAALLWVALQPTGADALLHLAQTVLPRYALTSLLLVLQVAAFVTLIGVGAGWLVAAYEFPGRRVLEVALILPLAMPAFVLAYAYTDFLDTSGPLQTGLRALTGRSMAEWWFPPVRSLPGAAIFLSLALYPYVYMLARNAFAERSASLAEAARSLGMPAARVWWRVTWPVARPAVAAGLTLVTMETLADFGTVSFFAVDTFSAGIYRAWQGLGDRAAAARLALVLLAAVLALVWLERSQRGRMAFHTRAARPAVPRRLRGAAAWGATAACALPVLLGFVLPVGLLLRAGLGEGAAVDPRLLRWAANTALLSALAVAAIVPLALGLAYAVRLARARWVPLLAAVAGAGYAVPGVVLGVGLLGVVGAVDRAAAALGAGGLLLGGTAAAVVYAYCVRFLAVAQHGLEAGLKRISPSMDASARTLGAGGFETLRRVHAPLLAPSLATAALLVFVDCLKELPATLVLRPFDFDTLAVVAYHFAADERLGEAALPSLAIVLVGLLPVAILARGVRRGARRG